MALDTGRGKLYDAMKTLKAQWQWVQSKWKDVAQRDFEETYWDPLVLQVDAVIRATDRLGQQLRRLKEDCA